jgi:hypothetical protein
VVERAWEAARRAWVNAGLPVPDFLRPPKRILRVRDSYTLGSMGKLFGIYQHTKYLDPVDGSMLHDEQIVLFLEDDCLVQEVLIHEMIHAVHARACFLGFACEVDPEAFVQHVFPDRWDFPKCPEESDALVRPYL